MSSAGTPLSRGAEWAAKFRALSLRSIFAGMLFSVVAHGLLVFCLLTWGIRGCGDGGPMAVEGELREVGIFVKSPEQGDAASELVDAPPPEDAASESPAAQNPVADVPQTPPATTSLPALDVPRLGPGGGSFSPSPGASSARGTDMVRPNGVARPLASGSLGPGQLRFFNLRDKGEKIVFVVDSSGSMAERNAMGVAKAQLLACLEQIDESQQFQVIFYNQTPRIMTLNNERLPQLYWGTQINRTRSRQFIASIVPDRGTEHLPALKAGLDLQPDVLFFLTDAQQPELTAGELNTVKSWNRVKSRVHCIEFGKGPELRDDNFLKRLARQNGGSYRYFDVTRFSGR